MNAVWSLITGVVNAVLAVITGNALRVLFHPQTHTKEFSVEVVKPDDLLVLTLDFYNIRLQGTGPGPLPVDRVEAGESRWTHAFSPVPDPSNKRTELWHTRLSPGATTAGRVSISTRDPYLLFKGPGLSFSHLITDWLYSLAVLTIE